MTYNDGVKQDGKASTPKRPDLTLPDDYDSEDDFCRDMRETFSDDVSYDNDNAIAGKEDQQFFIGNQWDAKVKSDREGAGKPCLTTHRILAFVAQICGSRRLNETQIKVVPDKGATKEKAKVREGLIRNIQKVSRAKIAYDKALENEVICGIGNFEIDVDYESDEVFEQCIYIVKNDDPFAIVWDRRAVDPTGKDARHVFTIETMSRKDFEREYPWATATDMDVTQSLINNVRADGWYTQDDVRIVAYWRMLTKPRTLALMADGTTQDITDGVQGSVPVAVDLSGAQVTRQVKRKYAQRYLCSGQNILEGPYDLPISRVPVFRVPGWEVAVEGKKYRWGLVRFLKDPQRLHNFWRSAVAEKLLQAPKQIWLLAQSAVAGRLQDYENAHLPGNNKKVLLWNDESGHKPELIPPPEIPVAMLQQADLSNQDLKDVSNIHEANLGMPSNEVSGAAIIARQRVSDTGTIIYHDNLALAIEECGRTIDELINVVYDTQRTITVIGDDDKEMMLEINREGDAGSDITEGKYSVSTTTGPSTPTKRIEAAQSMQGLANAAPQLLSTFADLYVEAQDWPMADKIAKRIQRGMPPGLLDPADMTPEQQQAAAATAAQQQQQMQLAVQSAVAEYMKTQSEAALNAAKAADLTAKAQTEQQNANSTTLDVASKAAERELRGRLDTIETAHGGASTSG